MTVSIKAATELGTADFAKAQDAPIIYNYLRHPDCRRDLIKWVAVELVRWQSLYNVARPLSDMQVVEVAKLVVTEYSDLTVEDIGVFFGTMKAGHIQGNDYPTMIDRIDWQYIRMCLALYMDAKQARKEWLHQQNKAKPIEPLQGIVGKEKALEYIQQMLERTKPRDPRKELEARKLEVIGKARTMQLPALEAWLASETDLVTKEYIKAAIASRHAHKSSPSDSV